MTESTNSAHFSQLRLALSAAPVRRYALAMAIAAAAFVCRIALGVMIPRLSPYTMFVPAVLLSAWFAGMGPGILATLIGAILGNYYFIGPGHEFDFDLSSEGRTLVFILVGAQVSWMSGRMHAARFRAETDAAAARQSERLYRTLASNFPDGFVCLVDPSLRCAFAGAGLPLAGLATDGNLKPLHEAFSAPAANLIESLCVQAIKGNAVSSDVRHQSRIYAAHFLPLPQPAQGAFACMGIFEDITQRAHAIEQLQWAHAHLEQRVSERTAELHFQKTLLESQNQASLDGILAVSRSGQIIFDNQRLHALWGIPDDPVPLSEVMPAIRRQLVSPRDLLTLELSPEAGVQGIAELSLLDGRSLEYHSAPIVDPDGNFFGRVWFFRDITDRKRLEQLILQAGERERQRIGQDLHDDLCQQLTGIAYAGRLLHKKLSLLPAPADLAAAASTIVHLIQQANERARELAQGLHPIQLQRKGLDAVLQELAASVGAMYEVDCQFRGSEEPIPLDDATALHLYRIAQEAISNAVRHGKSRHVQVDLIAVENRLILSIEDDGVGLPQTVNGNGLGLETMSYRARMVGGTFSIESGQDRGTSVTVCIPLKTNAPAINPTPSVTHNRGDVHV